ncbi:ATP-binding protein [Azospirillum sp. A26]|uniref:ATP-binding protein n=1 Tax=Azospirillum sp. A26 TaxID=3160607 RepID=UPI003672435F
MQDTAVVAALKSISVFGADQAGAYREHYQAVATVLGPDIPTKLTRWMSSWAARGAPGLVILTGNAGTGKTAAIEAYCTKLGVDLPKVDDLVEVVPGGWVVKDLSGVPSAARRVAVLEEVLSKSGSQRVICANEGVIRRTLAVAKCPAELTEALDHALRCGAAKVGEITVVNTNRQRPTAPGLWDRLMDYLTGEELWSEHEKEFDGLADPVLANVRALREPEVREALRLLFRYAGGRTVPTLRDVLSIVSWMAVGSPESTAGICCETVRDRNRDLGHEAFDSRYAYCSLLFGEGLNFEAVERSPVMSAIRSTGLGWVADLEVDEWLRDAQAAPSAVRAIAHVNDGLPPMPPSHLSLVRTSVGTMTFAALGETVSTSEDPEKVDACLDVLVSKDVSALATWRRRVFFECAKESFGSLKRAAAKLLGTPFLPDLLETARRCAAEEVTVLELQVIVKGLNMLVTGFPNVGEGLIVPDSASLFSRDPGAFRPAKPSVVHAQIPIDRLLLRCPDRKLVTEILDVDHIEIELAVDDGPDATVLRIGPEIYEAIRQAEAYSGPVGNGTAEMTELRDFYGRVALANAPSDMPRVTDPIRETLVPVRLPII